MKNEDIFEEVMSVVSDVTGMSERDILTSRTEEATDSRYLLVRALSKLGFTDTELASTLGCTRQAVGYLRNRYKKSGKWVLENGWKSISKWVENRYLDS